MMAKHLLEQLVGAATNALAMPRRNEPAEILTLAENIVREQTKPAPDQRLLFEEDCLLAQVIAMHVRALLRNEDGRADTFAQVIGVLLPISRAHLFAALRCVERPATTEQSR